MKMNKLVWLITVFTAGLIFIAASADKIQGNKGPGLINRGQSLEMKDEDNVKLDIKYGKIPLYFIFNKGQVNEKAKFYAKASRYTLWLTKQGLVFDSTMKVEVKDQHTPPFGHPSQEGIKKLPHSLHSAKYLRDVSRLIFLNADKNPEIMAVEKTQHRVNYFKGNDKSKWYCDIPTSMAVLYKNLYKNIDLKVYGIERQIEYDWIVKPGGNPEHIRFKYHNVKGTRIDKNGNLFIETDFGELIHKKPVSYQRCKAQSAERNAQSMGVGAELRACPEERKYVNVSFKKISENTYGFEVADYDKNLTLIIDPYVLAYSTYLGDGSGAWCEDYGLSIAVDNNGLAYVTGFTDSSDFPLRNPSWTNKNGRDAFVAKIDTTQNGAPSLVYSTYLGGDDEDVGSGIAIDSSGSFYVTGYTTSTDFPTNNQYQDNQWGCDAFVTKIKTIGNKWTLAYSTYLGGIDVDGGNDYGYGIAVDNSGNAYVTGNTNSTHFPLENQHQSYNNGYDAFVTKIDTTQSGASSLVYSTYLGGELNDNGYGIAVDNSGNAYVTGTTFSEDFPLRRWYQEFEGGCDAFVTKIDTTQSGDSSLVYSIYLGGDDFEVGYGIAVDNNMNAYVTGYTDSSNFPTHNLYQDNQGGSDVFITRINTTQSGVSSLSYSTYLGGDGYEWGNGIAVGSSGIVYVTGFTYSTNFPTRDPLQLDQPVKDVFVTKIDTNQVGDNSLIFSTYLGGGDFEEGSGIAVDSNDIVYVTGNTTSTNFPTNNQYLTYQGLSDAFITKLIETKPPTITTSPISNITQTTAAGGGDVISDCGSPVTARGVCWSTSPGPTISDDHTMDGTGTGTFTSALTGLSLATTYYVRAYATNSVDTAYGNEESFTTLALRPTVKTAGVIVINSTSVSCGGEVTSDGGSPVTARGVCWSTTPNPTTSNSHTTDGTGIGTFTSFITGLIPGTTYYVRAYATNSAGTAYGSDVSFIIKIELPKVITGTVSGITYTSAYCSGEVTSDGNSDVIARGVCWGTDPYPTVPSAYSTVDGKGLGEFNAALSGLTPGTFYYVRAYATNNSGTAYGDNVSFTTLSDKPVVVTGVVSDVTYTSASYSGNVTSEGISLVTARGVCWGTSPYPTTAGNKTMNGGGVGDFSGTLTGLTMNTTYYVRAYATNSSGTAYGGNVSFRTNPTALPTITTAAVTNISHTTASGGGNVTSDGGYTVTKRGICWGTSPDPTLSIINFTEDGGGTGEFSSAMTGLTPGTFYYVRAYATNSIGTAYGGNVGFSTNSAALPTVITSSVTTITGTTATGGGNVTSAGDSAVIFRGICWDTDPYPTTSNNIDITTDGVGTGEFSSAMTGLTPGVFYYVRAYATNSSGTAYGSNISFTTLSNLPTVISGPVSNVTYTSVSCSGNVTSEGSSLVTERGVCWSTTQNPTITSDSYTMNGGGTGEFSDSITGLSPNTTYYVRAYATNSSGTAYGGNVSFNTNPAALPTITTAAVTNVTQTTATGGGNVTSAGDSAVTARGICWGTVPYPSISVSNFTIDGTGTGVFTSIITGLTPGTVYYVRAYATNSSGTAYGDNMGFMTNQAALPLVTTAIVTGITGTTATGGGNVTSAGDSPVSARGVCWNTSPYPTLSTSNFTLDGSGTGEFVSVMNGLIPGTFYYVRAYATNGSGTSYGGNVSFTTISDLPTVIIGAVYNITYTSASCSANVTSQGTSPVTARGVCWGTSPDPGITTDSFTIDGGGTGDFYASITGLSPDTTYYVRPYATNSSGTAYGSNLSFTTNPAALPTVITATVTDITDTTATGGGNVTAVGDSAVIARGVCWGTSPYPVISATNFTMDGGGTGEFISVISGLTPETLYYARAYATNSSGTVYGSNVSFTTAPSAPLTPPLVQTAAISNITTTSASCGGNVIDDVGAAVTARGVCWNTSENPTTDDYHTLDGSGTGTFTSSITGLTEGVTYYVRAYATNKAGTGYGSQQVFTPGRPNPQDPPKLDVSRTHMNFTVMLTGTNVDTFTGNQRFFIVNTGGGTLEWTASPSDNWIKVSPANGIGDALVSVSINPTGLTIGENSGSLFISAPGAEDSPQTMTIYLRVAHNSEDTPPEGSFDTPLQGAWVSGSIPVTGWAIDDVEVTAVTIYRDPEPGEGNDWVYIGKGVFVEGARPDVEALYAGYPNNSTAGWGYMMLTHFLPNGGNGTITLHVEAVDTVGHKTLLGSKTIYCDNANAVKPFGAIDTPTQGGMSSGTAFINWGWALTPQPNYIPADGSTLSVFIDGKNQGRPQYNLYRDDVSRLLPGYVNSNNAGGYYTIDTTAFITGVHTIAWQVRDSAGNVDGIGSRYFITVNPRVSSSSANTSPTFYTGIPPVPDPNPGLEDSPLPVSAYLYLRCGWQDVNRRPRIMTPDNNGIFYLDIKELEPLEVVPSPGTKYTAGCMLVDGQHQPLPTGAGIDFQTGVFHWMPGPGFIGSYFFIFTGTGPDGKKVWDQVIVTIKPKKD